jgi:putative transposase
MDGPRLVQAFPWDSAPGYLLRDRDQMYGEPFPATVHSMGILEVLTAPQSPWQNPYCERLIGSIRRECLDHFIVFHERGLHRTLKSYFEYYERSRTHLSLDKDAPLTRAIHPPEFRQVFSETEEFVPSRLRPTLFQRDRIFGRDRDISRN